MKAILLSLFTLFLAVSAIPQCPECTPDETCVSPENFPIMCPEVLPPMTAGVYGEQLITVYLPSEVDDPKTNITATLLQVIIVNVTGVPFGLDFVMNNEDNTYYPNDGDTYGCATVCGTPLVPGDYEVEITALVTVEVLGFETEIIQPFILLASVIAGEGGNNSFTYDNFAGCGSMEVNFEGLIDGDPQPTTWAWDFGNGNSGDGQFPPTQSYDEPGEYTVSLTTSVFDNVLNSVFVTSLADGWWGDIEELTTLQNPDPFFVITNAFDVAIYTSSAIPDVQSGSWLNIGLVINDPPYTINFWDEDLISADDFLGSWTLPEEVGSFVFDAGGTNGSLNIDLELGAVFNDDVVLEVFPLPDAEFTFNDDDQSLYFSDPELEQFQWFFNAEPVDGGVDSLLILTAGGLYSCLLTNIYGCTALSDDFAFCPNYELVFNSDNNSLEAPEGFTSYQWFYNGLEIDGATTWFVDANQDGNYSLDYTTDYGCEGSSMVFTMTSISENTTSGFDFYPNPTRDQVYIKAFAFAQGGIEVSVIDQRGRVILQEEYNASPDAFFTVNLAGISAGFYVLRVSSGEKSFGSRLVVR